MHRPLVVIIMGSSRDQEHCTQMARAAEGFGLDVVLRVGSAHKTPAHVLGILRHYESEDRPRVYITVAGRSNALSGMVDGCVSAPVIACPPPSEAFAGADLFSSLRGPTGIAPAVVLEPTNAVLLAAKILGMVDKGVRAKVEAFQREQSTKVLDADEELNP